MSEMGDMKFTTAGEMMKEPDLIWYNASVRFQAPKDISKMAKDEIVRYIVTAVYKSHDLGNFEYLEGDN